MKILEFFNPELKCQVMFELFKTGNYFVQKEKGNVPLKT